MRRPEHGRLLGHRLAGVRQCACDAEVHDLDLAAAREHHVGGLDVAVDDPVAVAVVERGQNSARDLQGPLRQEPSTAGQELTQRHAVDELHDDVGHDRAGATIGLTEHVLTGVVHGDDVGVVERGGALRLAAEARLEAGIAGEVGAQDLHSDASLQPQVATLEDLGHPTSADDLTELIALAESADVLAHRSSLWGCAPLSTRIIVPAPLP